jgi:serine/threonine protein kinase
MAGDDRVPDQDGIAGPAVSSPAGALAPGGLIAQKYELRHALGSGGMGVVWAARHLETGVMTALKFLRTGHGGADDPDSLKRFLREARAAASVRHPHVVAIREILELSDGRPVMVMELLSGETLRTRLTRAPRMSLEEAARILLPVASAVGTAHAQGIVHRDLKPDNIFLSQDATGASIVKVLDFGIAKVTRPADEHASHGHGLTGSGEVLGTPNYMSPEQVFGERDIDQRSDIWALGVILYECLSGIVPTKAANVGQVFKLIVAGGIKPLSGVLPDCPDDITDLVYRMLARRRDQRPFDLNEIAEVLRRYTPAAVPPFGAPHIPGGTMPSSDGAGEPSPNADETLRRLGITDSDVSLPGDDESAPRRNRVSRLTTIGLGILVVSGLIGESLLLWRARTRRAVVEAEAAGHLAAPVDAGRATPRVAPAAPAGHEPPPR